MRLHLICYFRLVENNEKDRKYNVGTLLSTKSTLGKLSLEIDEDNEEVATNENGNITVIAKPTGKNKVKSKI